MDIEREVNLIHIFFITKKKRTQQEIVYYANDHFVCTQLVNSFIHSFSLTLTYSRTLLLWPISQNVLCGIVIFISVNFFKVLYNEQVSWPLAIKDFVDNQLMQVAHKLVKDSAF